jgi:hypothetical protein
MAPRVDVKQGEIKNHVAKALKLIRDGYVIVAPAEHGYIYLADAFSHFAVRAMHVLRGDELGFLRKFSVIQLRQFPESLAMFSRCKIVNGRVLAGAALTKSATKPRIELGSR